MYCRKPEPLDISPYQPGANNPDSFYGLPKNVQFCNSCVMSNQRPNAVVEYQHVSTSRKATLRMFDDGKCEACRVWDAKHHLIDWEERDRQLIDLCNRYRRNDGRYDCIVPGSGGKDSFMQSYLLKYKYGMHPLTLTWAPNIYTTWGFQNFQNWIHSGFDNILVHPNGKAHRLLTRLALENLYHPFQPFIFGQKMIAAKYSTLHDIPLVFYGDMGADHGQPLDEEADGQMEWDYFLANGDDKTFLGGTSLSTLMEDFGLERADLSIYLPIDPQRIHDAGTQIHFLGYYMKWHPLGAFYFATDHSNFRPADERSPGTYTKFNSIDDKMDDLHWYTTFIKFGVGRASYEASVDVRAGDITRDEAVGLVKKFDGEFPHRFMNEILEYLSIPEAQFPRAFRHFEQPTMDMDYFNALTDRARSPHLWKFENGGWALRHSVEAV